MPNIPNQNKYQKPNKVMQPPKSSSLLDVMVDGREFESLLHHSYDGLNTLKELRRCLEEFYSCRNNYTICYVANVIKPRKTSVSIDDGDDLPFREMVKSVPDDVKEIDLVLVTPGGYASQVAKFVNALRPRFDKVNFILLNVAMSAGTIFCMSGDEIVMSDQSYFGPIDPQVRNKDNQFVPIQSILTLINDIKDRGEIKISKREKPDWSDLELLRNMDPKEIGTAINASSYSIQLVEQYLYNYKFKHWINHSNGSVVSDLEKQDTAKKIAEHLCDNSKWKIHGHAIDRNAAWDVCKLKITHPESIPDLNKTMRRMWAVFYWMFENTQITKVFISKHYSIFKHDPQQKA